MMSKPAVLRRHPPAGFQGPRYCNRYDEVIQCGNVEVAPGDIIFADFDGIVVIPKHMEGNVFEKAIEKVNAETLSRKELQEGKTLREVFDKYKAL